MGLYGGEGNALTGELFASVYFDFCDPDDRKLQDEYIDAFKLACEDTFKRLNGLDLTNVEFKNYADPGYDPSNKLHNLLKVGTARDDPKADGNNTSYIHGDRSSGFMYYNGGDPTSYAAHEFGHLFGLADRYLEAVQSNHSNTIKQTNPQTGDLEIHPNLKGRVTPPMYLSDKVDDQYDPFANLYSAGEDRITDVQKDIMYDINTNEPAYGDGHTVLILPKSEVDKKTYSKRAYDVTKLAQKYAVYYTKNEDKYKPDAKRRDKRLGLEKESQTVTPWASLDHDGEFKYNSDKTEIRVEKPTSNGGITGAVNTEARSLNKDALRKQLSDSH
jgi:hypothetical protein